MKSPRLHIITAWAVFTVALAMYLLTVGPTIAFWDNAEFIACSHILGIPHPPGAPFLTLAGRVMMMLPFLDPRGSGFAYPAFRANLIAVFAAAFTVLLTYLITVQLITRIRAFGESRSRDRIIVLSAAIAALMAGFAHQFWENAVELETYMPSLLMSMIALWLTLRWELRKDDHRATGYLMTAAYLVGLGVGIHLSALLIAPAILLIVITARPDWFSDNRTRLGLILFIALFAVFRLFAGKQLFYTIMAVSAMVAPVLLVRFARSSSRWTFPLYGTMLAVSCYVIGYSVYPTIMIRAHKDPMINQGDPDTWERYGDYLERRQYDQGNMYTGMFSRNANASYQFGFMYLRYFLHQFPQWGPSPGITFENDRSPDRPGTAIVSDTAYLPILLIILMIIGFAVHLRRDPAHGVPILLFFLLTSIGLVLYLDMENPQARERDYFFLGSFQIVTVWLGIGLAATLDRTRMLLEKRTGAKMAGTITAALSLLALTMVPAAVLSRHIEPEYSNFALHDRSGNFIALDYAVNMLNSCEENAILFAYGDNDTFPLWYAQYVRGIRPDIRVINLSILNGPWYIKQLRDDTPTVPIELSDDFIDNRLASGDMIAQRTLRWTPQPRTVNMAGITWDMPPSYAYGDTGFLTVATYMTAHIIDQTNWRRPIYFAVGVPPFAKIGLDAHMRMEGLVFRLVREKNTHGPYHVDPQILSGHMTESYRYRGINDPHVYKSDETRKLLRNYAIAFADLADAYLNDDQPERAVQVVNLAIGQLSPGLEMRMLLASILLSGGLDNEFQRLLDEDKSKTSPELREYVVDRYWKTYISVLYQAERFDDALDATERYLDIAPNNAEARRMRSALQQLLKQRDTTDE